MRLTSIFALLGIVLTLQLSPVSAIAQEDHSAETVLVQENGGEESSSETVMEEEAESGEHHGAHHLPPVWLVIPFITLLLMIATGPLFYAHFWHKYYPHVAILLGAMVVAFYLFVLHDHHQPIHSLAEYVSFIALLTALFVASGGILIKVDKKGTPLVNIALLVFGAAIANVIGTTGASMLLIRPFIRLNQDRIKPYHIVFFIFMVSNVGGCLTPIGDPPLFLGFLKGVPFEWTLIHVWPVWIFGIAILAIFFFFIDSRNKPEEEAKSEYTGKIQVIGLRNVIFLAITIGAVFLDPNVVSWVPGIEIDGTKFSFIRELIMFAVAAVSFYTSDKEALKGNEFNFEPIREVAFLFIGIFATMMPALQLISDFASNNTQLISANSLYWMTGSLSGVLDNAPTYLNFMAAGMGKVGLDIGSKQDVLEFVAGSFSMLLAISVSSVFFGAFTYIGNAPNFMVKSIAEQAGIKMPSFAGYVVRYSIPILLPMLFLSWLLLKFGFF